MFNGNYKSLGTILWKVLKNPLAAEITYEEAAEYALEFIKLLGVPMVYLDKIHTLELTMHKAELPCDLLYLNGVRYVEVSEDGEMGSPIAMREATNVYHSSATEHANEQDTEFDLRGNHRKTEFTYSIQKGIIFTSMLDGFIEVAYKAIATDEDGYPLIPDHEKVTLGIEYYVLSRYLEPLWMMGKITDKAFEYIQQKRYFYMPSAFTSLQMPSLDKMETLMNSLNRLIINTTAHQNFFKKAGEKERMRRFR
jgi:hypothetical protein